MSSNRLRARIPGATTCGRAQWPGMRLVFNKVGSDGSGKANLVEDTTAIAWGVLFWVATADWARLDDFEPGYGRTSCNICTDSGELRSAHVYLGTGPTHDTPPHGWYRDHLVRGAIEHDLPQEIITMIRVLQPE
jgi:gamma-glutamylcyclotransferase